MERKIKFRAWDIGSQKMYKKFTVIPEDDKLIILMQYTGKKDMSGKEIYEGDIIDYGSDGLCEIVYHNGYIMIDLNKKEHSRRYVYITDGVGIVVGNIYENTDLLNSK